MKWRCSTSSFDLILIILRLFLLCCLRFAAASRCCRPVQDGARQRDALRAFLRQEGLQQLPTRLALPAVWAGDESPEHIGGDAGDDHQHHRAAGGPSRHFLTVLRKLQVRRRASDVWEMKLLVVYLNNSVGTDLTANENKNNLFPGRCVFSGTSRSISPWFILDRKVCRKWSHRSRKCLGLSSCAFISFSYFQHKFFFLNDLFIFYFKLHEVNTQLKTKTFHLLVDWTGKET